MFQRQCYLRKALMQPVPFNDIIKTETFRTRDGCSVVGQGAPAARERAARDRSRPRPVVGRYFS